MPTFEPPASADVISSTERDPVLKTYRMVKLANRLYGRYQRNDRGLTVLKIGGTYSNYTNPDSATIATATEVYLGGHTYVIDDATATALTNAGYTVDQLGGYAQGYFGGY